MKHLPTTRQIQYFISLAQLKSFSKAANDCNVTQSTLSASIQDLENILSLKLVDRSARQISLTSAGIELLSTFKEIIETQENLIEKAKFISNPKGGIIRLGIIPTIAPYYLPKILPAIKDNLPDLDIRIIENLSSNLLDKINNKELDIIIMALPYPTPGLKQQKIFKEEFYIITHKNNEDFINDYIDIKDIKTANLLMMEDGHCLKDHAMEACHINTNGINKSISASSINTLIQLVSQNYGSTLIPAMCLNSIPDNENLKIVSFNKPEPTRSIGFIWNEHRGNQEQIQNLIQVISNLRID